MNMETRTKADAASTKDPLRARFDRFELKTTLIECFVGEIESCFTLGA
jgi:hypothetical protein